MPSSVTSKIHVYICYILYGELNQYTASIELNGYTLKQRQSP